MTNLIFDERAQQALDVMNGSLKHLFLTGKAGTGKSTLLKHFLENSEKNMAVLAPTGVAALNVGGSTIHSFFGFTTTVTVKKAKSKGKREVGDPKFTELHTIVIDEISMVRADMFDCIDIYLKEVRQSKEPFGGVQMIMIGDLYQLSPVISSSEKLFFEKEYASPYFFSAKVVQGKRFRMECIELDTIYRQSDSSFIEILNAMRTKTIEDRHFAQLNRHVVPTLGALEEGMIYLAGTNAQVDQINQKYLDEIKVKPSIFTATVKGEVNEKQFPTAGFLGLKVGAQVMFVNNDPEGRWVNGSLGKIKKIKEDMVIVQLFTEDGGEEVEVTPHTWKVSQYDYDPTKHKLSGSVVGSFTQIPLTLAWAITIHKSQGKTFDKVVIDLRTGIFAHGQTYVALSRCRSLEGIQFVSEVRPSHIKLDPAVVEFLGSM